MLATMSAAMEDDSFSTRVGQASTPLLITSLGDLSEIEADTTANRQGGSWEVLQRLITAHPVHPEVASIETVLEAWKEDSVSRFMRVAVYSGPDSAERSLHSSFQLPTEARPPGAPNAKVLTWTAFPQHPTHQLLCVLANRTTLSIWDVYPGGDDDETSSSSSLPTDGWTITLPFECCSIHAIGDAGGLFLQRQEDAADRVEEDEDVHGFILKSPPKFPLQKPPTDGTLTPAERRASATPKTGASTAAPGGESMAVNSLFSLLHPLEDILPVSQLLTLNKVGTIASRPVTDVFEKLLWVGTAAWVDPQANYLEKRIHRQVLAVTYHTQKERHAIWAVQDAPPPPAQPPLYRRTRQFKSADAATLNSHMEDLELLGMGDGPGKPSVAPQSRVSRDEALADALGVRRTPRKSLDVANTTAVGSRSRRRTNARDSMQHSSFFSPTNQSVASTTMDVSMSGEGSPILPSSSGPFSSLHASLALKCLFKEKSKSSTQAEAVFLVSNIEASGTLVLCTLCPSRGGKTRQPKELRLFSLQPSPLEVSSNQFMTPHRRVVPGPEHSLEVKPLESVACLSAVSIQAIPSPPCFHPHSKYRKGNKCDWKWATDLMILRRVADGRTILSLHRGTMHVVDYAFAPTEHVTAISDVTSISDIGLSVRNRITVTLGDGRYTKRIRGLVPATLRVNALSEKVLSALDAALFSAGVRESDVARIATALLLRADCCRLVQSLCHPSQDGPLDDIGSSALEAVLLALVQLELSGKTPSAIKSRSKSSKNAWESLLASEFHRAYSAGNEESLFLCPVPDGATAGDLAEQKLTDIGSNTIDFLKKNDSKSLFPCLFDALHLLYEELKLSISIHEKDLQQLACLAARICETLDHNNSTANAFLDYYRRDLGDRVLGRNALATKTALETIASGRLSSFTSPPSFFAWVDRMIKAENTEGFYDLATPDEINAACSKTRSIHRVLSVLFAGDSPSRDLEVVVCLIEEGFVEPSLVREEFPPAICLPILEVLYRCRSDPALSELPGWSASAWSLVGREDLSRNMSETITAPSPRFVKRRAPAGEKGISQTTKAASDGDEDNDGLVPLEHMSSMLFPEDNRVHEAARLLRSSRPIFLRVPRAIEVSDHDYERLKQKRLMHLSYRALALPIGRGMLTIGSLSPVAAEPLPLPELCLKGRVPPTNAALALDVSECPSDMLVWPEFHNGVAAGLRLPLDCDLVGSGFKITRNWIVYNRPARSRQNQPDDSGNDTNPPPLRKSHSHAGLLLALGLRGYLTALDHGDLYDYLQQGTVTTTIGVLLGMAANKRGSCDISLSKMISLHIPSLMPQHFSVIDVACSVQTAAVTSAGLLFQRSSHRMMTEFLINEIGKRPESDATAFDREAYTLSCGVALGMVNLCLGEASGDMDRAAGIADLRLEERLHRYIVGGIDNDEWRRTRELNDRFSLPSPPLDGDDKCSTIFEGGNVNTDITTPGATLALGLMYMKTENHTIASTLKLPDTHFLLEFVRPDFLALRVVSRALILWNEVMPTREWIEEQIPAVVGKAYGQMRSIAKRAMEGRSPTSKTRQRLDYDRRAARQIYVHVVAGACFGIGLRYAGTGDERAKEALFERLMELNELREANDAVSIASRPEFTILETCLSCAALSLAMVLAGTGDLDALKLFKILRWRCDEDSKYGHHMVYGMAIGLLFLGGGTCTLGRDPEDIAALVLAFFPRFPTTTSDNHYHVQAFRHLYALAVKRKELCAIDVDTDESVYVPVEIKSANTSDSVQMTVPCLLRNSDNIYTELRVVSDKYYPLKLDLTTQKANGYTFYVKKRNSQQSRCFDPYSHNVLARSSGGSRERLAPIDMVHSLTENPFLLAFANHFRGPAADANSDADFDSRVVLECLAEDTEEALAVYLALRSSSGNAGLFLWNLRLIRSYYNERSKRMMIADDDASSQQQKQLLNTEVLLPFLFELAERKLMASLDSPHDGALSFFDA